MKRIFLNTARQRGLSWGLIGAGVLLLALAPAGREHLWVPFVVAGVVVELMGIGLRHRNPNPTDSRAAAGPPDGR